MSVLAGIPSCISRPILGVIAPRPPFWTRGRPFILVVQSREDLKKLSRPFARRRWAACIIPDTLEAGTPANFPGVHHVPQEQCADLHEGDVVYLDPSGGISVFYTMGSPHNSILATNRCNCRCLMCPQPPDKDPEDLWPNNLQLISLLDPNNTECLGITGGEPTLLGEDLIELIRICRQQLPNTLLQLLTNGRKLKDLDYSRALVQAGLPRLFIEIPLFADNDTEHDVVMAARGSFYDTMAGLHNLARLGQPVGLRTVLHALTIPRLTQYAEFVYRNLPFVVQVAFMGMETIGLARDNIDRLWLDPYEYRHRLADAVMYLHRRMVPVSIYNHQLCVLPPEIWSFARKSITSWKQCYPPVCDPCTKKDRCGGVFGTSERNSAFLHPIT